MNHHRGLKYRVLKLPGREGRGGKPNKIFGETEGTRLWYNSGRPELRSKGWKFRENQEFSTRKLSPITVDPTTKPHARNGRPKGFLRARLVRGNSRSSDCTIVYRVSLLCAFRILAVVPAGSRISLFPSTGGAPVSCGVVF